MSCEVISPIARITLTFSSRRASASKVAGGSIATRLISCSRWFWRMARLPLLGGGQQAASGGRQGDVRGPDDNAVGMVDAGIRSAIDGSNVLSRHAAAARVGEGAVVVPDPGGHGRTVRPVEGKQAGILL